MIKLLCTRAIRGMITCFCCLCVIVVDAAPPKKPKLAQFTRLWVASPFTIKPVTQGGISVTPLEREWSLGGISPFGSGYSVTIINKKNRKERIRFIPGYESGAFKLLEVKQNPQSYKLSKVLIMKGGQKGWIGYDEKVLKLKSSGTSKPTRPQSSRNTHSTTRRVTPPIPGISPTNTRKNPRRRTRYVPRHR